MRSILASLIAAGLLGSGSEAAAAGGEWVVLRVERVEVAAAHADGSPWDDGTPTSDLCGVLGGGDELLASRTWGPIVRGFCPGGGGASPEAPDLFLRFSAGDSAEYLSPIAADVLAHDFHYEILVPLEAVGSQGLFVEVVDRDAERRDGGERLGAIQVSKKDIGRLLENSSREKTYSDDAVTRVDVSARRHRRPVKATVGLSAAQRAARANVRVIAGEVLELRTTRARRVVAVVGGNLHRVDIEGCVRGSVQTTGGVGVGYEDVVQSVDSVSVAVSIQRPSVGLWMAGVGGLRCDRKESVVTVVDVQALTPSSLVPQAVTAITRSRYVAGVQRCHERALSNNRTASGVAKVRLTVGPTGGVAKFAVKSFPAVESCIGSLVSRWRFGAPKDASGKPTSAEFEVKLTLGAL